MIVNKNIIFLGPPGSGKGTLSTLMEKEWNIKQISTGDIFREEIINKTKLGLEIKQIVESGNYVPDSIANEIVKNKVKKLENEDKKFILDGYPRTIQQAEFLDSLKLTKFVVLNLEIDDDVIIKRLVQRLFCTVCKSTYNKTNLKSKKHPYCEKDGRLLIQREDDKPLAIKKRLEVYHQQTSTLIDYYKKQDNLFLINSNNDIGIILGKIKGILNND